MFARSRNWIAVMAIALLLASCSGDDNGASDATPATAPETAVAATPSASSFEPAGSQPPATAEPSTPTSPSATATTSQAAATPAATEPAATSTPSSSATLDPEAVSLAVELEAEGFTDPLFMTDAPDGSGQLYVVERGGTIRLLSGELVLDITARVGSDSTEQGLLGLAFHPQYTTNGQFFAYYTDRNGDTVVSRFTTTDGLADPEGEEIILTQAQPASNHNGGMLAFGPDGYLYIGLGDGGRSYDAFGTAQSLDTLLGKLLRIDVDAADAPYAIPAGNPFVGGSQPEIWAYGLRNPWRFSFDALTGDLYIGDVGQNMFEWVHFQPAGSAGGENYGWPIFEGDHCLIEDRCDEAGFVPPIAVYGRDGGCAIIGGHVYRGQEIAALQGAYLFGDLCSGNVWATARDASGAWQTTLMLQVDAQISSFGLDQDGNIYITDLAGGRIFRLVAAGS